MQDEHSDIEADPMPGEIALRFEGYREIVLRFHFC